MLDQSYSAENFFKIFHLENRKGTFDRSFLSKEYLDAHEKVKQLFAIRSTINKEQFESTLAKLNEEKQEALRKYLEDISDQCNRNSFQFRLSEISRYDKAVYTIKKDAPSFFAMKQLQYNIARTFKVKQSNRYDIVKQLRIILEDGFPKYVVRVDLKSFYESISQELLLKKVDENQLLNFYSKRLIKSLLFTYEQCKRNTCENAKNAFLFTPKNKNEHIAQILELLNRGIMISEYNSKIKDRGVPRGVGVSAYLSELYMRDIDKEIQSLDDLVYYSRYVDDMVLVFIPPSKDKLQDYLSHVKGILIKFDLVLKDGSDGGINKTVILNLFEDNITINFDFLGYKFIIENSRLKELKLSDNKLMKYEERLKLTVEDYNRKSKFSEKAARKILISRIKFLTGNFRLVNNRKRIKSGIYYSNIQLKDNAGGNTELLHLNNLLKKHLAKLKPYSGLKVDVAKLKKRIIKRYCFNAGFKNRSQHFHSFKKKPFSEIVSIWKYNS